MLTVKVDEYLADGGVQRYRQADHYGLDFMLCGHTHDRLEVLTEITTGNRRQRRRQQSSGVAQRHADPFVAEVECKSTPHKSSFITLIRAVCWLDKRRSPGFENFACLRRGNYLRPQRRNVYRTCRTYNCGDTILVDIANPQKSSGYAAETLK